MSTLLGIETLKRAINFAVGLTKQIETSGRDGWDWQDSFQFFDELLLIPGLISSGDELKAEFNDLDDAERADLLTYFKVEFDLEDDKTEAIVENALAMVLQILSLLALVKKTTPPPAAL